jgi:type II secretory pathway component PulJ
MKCSRVRFTVRQMMIAVAVVAILATAGLTVTPEVSRRWNDCQIATNRQAQLAQMHATYAAQNATLNAKMLTKGPKRAAEQAFQRAALHREMSRRNWWAFFDPFHECVLDRDIY